MKRLIIICEGPTEVEFCKDVLYQHFFKMGIMILTPLIKKSGGGIVHWNNLKKQIENHLIQDQDAIVTTLFDYYGIKDKFDFPNWDEAKLIVNKVDRMAFIEDKMKDSIIDALRYRFYPYVQLHEFEGLLFNDITVFTSQIPKNDFVNREELESIINQNPNPELINDSPNNAPSYRLGRLIRGYDKIVYGAILAEKIGLARIRGKSLRFNEWVSKLEKI